MSDKELNEYLDEGVPDGDRGWLPSWWRWMGYGSLVFTIGFVVVVHGFMNWSQEKQYSEEVARHERMFPAQTARLNADGSNPFRQDTVAIAAGEKAFLARCAMCHKNDMTGLVGPSLVDTTWLHGSTDQAIFEVIMNGVEGEKIKLKKGPMPAHKQSVGAKGVLEILAFIASKNPSLTPN